MQAWEEEVLIKYIDETFPRYSGVEAYRELILREIRKTANTAICPTSVRAAIRALESNGQLNDELLQSMNLLYEIEGWAVNSANAAIFKSQDSGHPYSLEYLQAIVSQMPENSFAGSEHRNQLLSGRTALRRENEEMEGLRAEETNFLLDSKTGQPRQSLGTMSASPAQVFKAKKAEIFSLTLDQLRDRKAQRDENRRLRNASISELQLEARSNIAAQAERQGLTPAFNQDYEPLPEVINYYGEEVPLDAKFLQRAGRTILRSLINRYGPTNVNARLNQQVPASAVATEDDVDDVALPSYPGFEWVKTRRDVDRIPPSEYRTHMLGSRSGQFQNFINAILARGK
jgi:hypothetical protein